MMKKTSEELLAQRQQGILPTISIAGDEFTIDWSKRLLLLANDNTVQIDIGHLPLTQDVAHYYFYYHLPTKQKVQIKTDITALPKDTVMIHLPRETVLDPVGVAREMKMDDSYLLKAFPIQEQLTAVVVPLQQTGWLEKVKENTEHKKQSWLKRLKTKRRLR